MACDPKWAAEQLDLLTQETSSIYTQTYSMSIDWDSLQWSSSGPEVLFDQFRKAGSLADFIMAKVLDLEYRKSGVVGLFEDFRASVDKAIEVALHDKSRSWIIAGYAYQERAIFARIEVGDHVCELNKFDKKLEVLNNALFVLKARIKMFTDFKGDAKVVAALMNFGNQLGELR
jgi:hypothetical protein